MKILLNRNKNYFELHILFFKCLKVIPRRRIGPYVLYAICNLSFPPVNQNADRDADVADFREQNLQEMQFMVPSKNPRKVPPIFSVFVAC